MALDVRPVAAHLPWPTGAPTLVELLRPPAWHRDAACKEPHPGVSWFPKRGENGAAAKAVCAGCLVRDECRRWALAEGRDLTGVWGGLTPHERRPLIVGEPRGRQPSRVGPRLPRAA